jgi:hypothetical protein
VGLLDRVVQNARRYQVVRCAGIVEQRGDLERVQDKRGAIHAAQLPIVCSLRVCNRCVRLWKALDEVRHKTLAYHGSRAYITPQTATKPCTSKFAAHRGTVMVARTRSNGRPLRGEVGAAPRSRDVKAARPIDDQRLSGRRMRDGRKQSRDLSLALRF